MSADAEFWIAIGSPNGRRSTVWKFVVTGAEIYIFSRMFGEDTKVSLHSSGDCQLSGTSTWVRKVPGRKNADRHFHKWHQPRPIGNASQHAFRVVVPESELRIIDINEDLSDVSWLPAPSADSAIVLECYITPPFASDPSENAASLPLPRLCSLKLSDDRWLVVMYHAKAITGLDVFGLRTAVCGMARERGHKLLPQYRASLLLIEGPLRGLVELCPV